MKKDNLNKIEVYIPKTVEFPIHKDIIQGDTYIRIDLDGNKRNLIDVRKIENGKT